VAHLTVKPIWLVDQDYKEQVEINLELQVR